MVFCQLEAIRKNGTCRSVMRIEKMKSKKKEKKKHRDLFWYAFCCPLLLPPRRKRGERMIHTYWQWVGTTASMIYKFLYAIGNDIDSILLCQSLSISLWRCNKINRATMKEKIKIVCMPTVNIVVLKFGCNALGFSLGATGELWYIEFVLVTIWSSKHFLHFRVQLHLVRISIAVSLYNNGREYQTYIYTKLYMTRIKCQVYNTSGKSTTRRDAFCITNAMLLCKWTLEWYHSTPLDSCRGNTNHLKRRTLSKTSTAYTFSFHFGNVIRNLFWTILGIYDL